MVIYEYPLHLEVCLLTILLVLELDEGVLKAITRPLVFDDLARHDRPKAAEDSLQVLT